MAWRPNKSQISSSEYVVNSVFRKIFLKSSFTVSYFSFDFLLFFIWFVADAIYEEKEQLFLSKLQRTENILLAMFCSNNGSWNFQLAIVRTYNAWLICFLWTSSVRMALCMTLYGMIVFLVKFSFSLVFIYWYLPFIWWINIIKITSYLSITYGVVSRIPWIALILQWYKFIKRISKSGSRSEWLPNFNVISLSNDTSMVKFSCRSG